ncbi:hypothetical protein RF11_15703 [Thelohanellus kitauei]|uniref:Uncharacterized protein n=1 Tax=Thelohanellus kitauei TaxID=669202 RepID=A0A0C2N0L8_THEKT|nr:hypothetical protein RF11_15703 [Thelohanellus kitauei]
MFTWNPDWQDAFNKLQTYLSQIPLLHFSKPVRGCLPSSINSIDIHKLTDDNSVYVSVDELARRIVKLKETAKVNIEAKQVKYKFYYDRDCYCQEIKPGSCVRIKHLNPSDFSARYGKSVRVFRAHAPGTYVVEDGKGQQTVVVHNRLKMH